MQPSRADLPGAAPPRWDLPILHRDEALLAISKPSGLAVHRGWAADPTYAATLVRELVGRRVHPAHRLDRATSGVLLFALDAVAARAVGDAFAERRVTKRYLALVRGVAPAAGTIDHPVPRGEDRKGPRVDAATVFRRLATLDLGHHRRYSVVEASPRTGRLHQIRRHFKHISHPLVGDVRYGKGEHNRFHRVAFGLHRLALHAWRLDLAHPVTAAPLSLIAPLPADLAEPLRQMGLRLEDLSPSDSTWPPSRPTHAGDR